MSPLELVLVLSVIANAMLMGFVVADLHRLLVQHHTECAARRADEARRVDQERKRAELRAAQAHDKAARDERETAEREVRRRRKAARDEQRRKAGAETEAARFQRLESILMVTLTHIRHMDPEVAEAEDALPSSSQPRKVAFRDGPALALRQKATVRPPPGASDEPDSERSRPTADLGIVSSPVPSRGPSQAMLPPPPAPPDDDAALRAAGLHKRSGVAESTRPPPHRPPVPMPRTRSDTRPSIPSPVVRDRGAAVPVVDMSTQERPSFEELTVVTDRGMDLRLQVAQSGPLVGMRFEAQAAPESPARKPEAR
jgi:hypothetical protein